MTLKDSKGLYIVFYEIIGSRCNGMFLVRAANQRDARKIVLALNVDYVVRNGVQSVKAYVYDVLGVTAKTNVDTEGFKEVFAEELEMFLGDVKLPKRNGGSYHMEEGT